MPARGETLATSKRVAVLGLAALEHEGWQRPRSYRHRLPSGADFSGTAHPAHDTALSRSAASNHSKAPEPPAAVDDGLPVLTIRRPYAVSWAARTLSIWIGQDKVAELAGGSSTRISVPPGKYTLIAAGQGPMTLPRLELELSVAPGSRLVAE